MKKGNIPDSIRMNGQRVNIAFSPTLLTDRSECGVYHDARMVINLAEELPPEKAEQIFLHEIVEAINESHELNLPHRTICTLSQSLYQVLADNCLRFGRVESDGER